MLLVYAVIVNLKKVTKRHFVCLEPSWQNAFLSLFIYPSLSSAGAVRFCCKVVVMTKGWQYLRRASSEKASWRPKCIEKSKASSSTSQEKIVLVTRDEQKKAIDAHRQRASPQYAVLSYWTDNNIKEQTSAFEQTFPLLLLFLLLSSKTHSKKRCSNKRSMSKARMRTLLTIDTTSMLLMLYISHMRPSIHRF